jgi:hypothetical protein
LVKRRRRGAAPDPSRLRNAAVVVVIPVVAIPMVLAWTNAGDGWWLLTAVLSPVYFAAIVAAYFWRTFGS